MHRVLEVPNGLQILVEKPYVVKLDSDQCKVYIENICMSIHEVINYTTLEIPTRGFRGYKLCMLPDAKLAYVKTKLLYEIGGRY